MKRWSCLKRRVFQRQEEERKKGSMREGRGDQDVKEDGKNTRVIEEVREKNGGSLEQNRKEAREKTEEERCIKIRYIGRCTRERVDKT